MIYLDQGTVLPVISTLQILLRNNKPYSTIAVNGNFDAYTRVAVVNFQKFNKSTTDGVIGKDNWDKLTSPGGLQTIDVIDGTDPSLLQYEAKDIRKAGGNPIILFGMSNGVEEMVNAVSGRASGAGKIGLLRFHGHGAQGSQNVSAGTKQGDCQVAGISDDNFAALSSLARLQPLFSPYGSVQLLGCNVGGGSKGKSLVNKLAGIWGVPVTAAIEEQFAGGRNTFTFEGPTVSGFPGSGDLKGWSKALEMKYSNCAMAS